MNRREFLKSALTAAALMPITRLAAGDADGGNSGTSKNEKRQITRRRYKNTDLTLPLLGFGMMRLPRLVPGKPEIDYAIVEKQIARAMEVGLNYFDTAYFYHNGLSEKCAGDLLSKYPRESYLLADKMPVRILRREADLERIFNEQLQKCKTGYFDFYLLHSLNKELWDKAKRLHVYEFLRKKQDEGKIRKLGFSFHDTPEVLKTIAEAYPWDFAQIQLNYLDWTAYRSREQYEILTRLGIPVVVMEPLRGGALASLNPEAAAVLKNANPDASVASWAFRYVGSMPNVICALSGMTLMEHLEDNINTFTDFKPLTDLERRTIAAALAAYHKTGAIPCTACAYCIPCPTGVDIPRIFSVYNQYKTDGDLARFRQEYNKIPGDERADICIKCGICRAKCPQKIDIPDQLTRINEMIISGRGH